MTAFCKGKKEDCSLTEFHWHWNVPGASSCQPQAPKDRSASHQKLQQAPEEYQEGLDISTGSVPPIILCICHCHLRPWFAVFSYLWVTSHHQKKRRERVNWSRGKVPQKRRKKKKLIDILFLPVFICKEKGSFDLIWKTWRPVRHHSESRLQVRRISSGNLVQQFPIS